MFDIYEEVTKRVIEKLENGVIPWRKPWKTLGVQIKNVNDYKKVAFNRVSKTAYSPLNQMLLSKAGEYATFNQWKDLGGKIKKGSKAEMVVFWKILEQTKIDEETNELIKYGVPYLRYYQVFHIDDVEGVKPLEFSKDFDIKEFDSIEEAENVISKYTFRENIKINFGGDSAFYSPTTDSITLPNKYQFNKNTNEFYSTAFHEIVHSTGSKSRLDRLSSNAYFGNNDYSKEELVAEIGACGLMNMLDIETNKTFDNSVAYIQSWIQQLKNDKKFIVSASSKAEKAVDFILYDKNEKGVD